MADQDRVLLTGGRFPGSVGLAHALIHYGTRVDVADSYKLAPSLHARGIAQPHVVPAPAKHPVAFTDAVARIVADRDIGLVIPTFEEGFYLSRYRDRVPVPIFAPAFETVLPLHDKARFQAVCHALDLPTPPSVAVTSGDALRHAIGRFERYLARPAFSRAGAFCLTNHGPRAGEMRLDDCRPTDDNPWLVQEFVDGRDACSFSVVRDGRVVVHCAYEPVIAAASGFSVQFRSIDDFGALRVAQKVAGHFGYTGFLGFDYRRTEDGFVLIECNPRLDAGVFVTPFHWIGEAVLGEPEDLRIAPAGVKKQYDALLIGTGGIDLSVGERLKQLLTTPDALVEQADFLPSILYYAQRRHWKAVAQKEHIPVDTASHADIAWDGTPMPEPSEGSEAV
ncbi:ATP-grasp domain-containing protein [Bauldia sp.]|uniref:ATP-grasp domain-containing protein n=1 Tax=Bauldia sp. TaxID=2575872 RepID=UPI003BAC6C2D